MRVVSCRMDAPCHHLLRLQLCARMAGRNERLFLAGHSAGGQISAEYAQRLAGGLILLACAQHRKFLQLCCACCVPDLGERKACALYICCKLGWSMGEAGIKHNISSLLYSVKSWHFFYFTRRRRG